MDQDLGLGTATVGQQEAPLALDDLFRLHADALIRLAYLLTGSEAVAEDLVQDVFARLARRTPSMQTPDAYLRRSVVNATRSWHRRRRLELHHARTEVPEHASLGARELLDALRVLTPRERAVIVLHYYEGRTIDEVAAVLGCARGTAGSSLSRALAKLRKVLEP